MFFCFSEAIIQAMTECEHFIVAEKTQFCETE